MTTAYLIAHASLSDDGTPTIDGYAIKSEGSLMTTTIGPEVWMVIHHATDNSYGDAIDQLHDIIRGAAFGLEAYRVKGSKQSAPTTYELYWQRIAKDCGVGR
jgi:hypothetical protein